MFNNLVNPELIAAIISVTPSVSNEVITLWLEDKEGIRKILNRIVLPPLNLKIFQTLSFEIDLSGADNSGVKIIGPDDFKTLNFRVDVMGDADVCMVGFGPVKDENFTLVLDMDLVIVSVKNLGFDNGARLEDIFMRANNLGLMLCPMSIAFVLRENYQDQAVGETLVIATSPIKSGDGTFSLFGLRSSESNGKYLGVCCGDLTKFWEPETRFIFCSNVRFDLARI